MSTLQKTRQTSLEKTQSLIAEYSVALQDKMQDANSLVREVSMPLDIATAFLTGRPELMLLAKPRALTAEECDVLYKLLGTLFETNVVLKNHAAQTAELAKTLTQGFTQVVNAARNIEHFANFRAIDTEDEDMIDN